MKSFMVEASAEMNPFTPDSLHVTLQKAASNDVNQIQTSTKQLQQWETKEGYYSALQDVFIQRILPEEVRLMALIQFKNGVDKYWRKSAASAIKADERSTIRMRLLQSSMNESAYKLASLNSIVTAKIARHDFPGQWPDLIAQLLELVTASLNPGVPQEHISRALLITHHVIKELATIRLQRPRSSLLSSAPELFRVLRDCYFFKVQQWQRSTSSPDSSLKIETLNSLGASEQTLKILRRLIMAGYDFPHRNGDLGDFWVVTATHVQLYLQMLHQTELQNAYRIAAGRHVKQLAKLHLAMAKDHPVSFALLPGTVDLVQSYWAAAKQIRSHQLSGETIEEEVSEVYDTFNLRAIHIMRACFKEAFTLSQPFKYRNSDGKDEPVRAKKLLSDELFSTDFIRELFQTLVSNFFIYLKRDVEEFFSEPDEWDMKDEGDEEAYDKSVRAASERLFMDISLHYKDVIVGPLLETVANLSGSTGYDTVLLKDAVYAAIGIAAPVLHTRFDFNNFLVTTLVSDLQQTDMMYNIVRRRIAITLARWIPVDVSLENRALVYDIFQSLLSNRAGLNSQGVRIAAGKRLNDVVDEIAFQPESFAQYAAGSLYALLDLIREVDVAETKLALLNTVSTIVERMDADVTAFSHQIVEILQELWSLAASENMMKTVIVTILTKLVRAMKAESAGFHTVMLAIVKDALEPGSESQVYLLDDALDLWTAILRQSHSPLPQSILELVSFLFGLFDLDDSMPKALVITKSYILLAPSEMLHDNIRGRLFVSFHPLLSVRDAKVAFAALENVNLMIRASDALGGEQAVRQVTNDLMECSLLPHMMESLNLSWESRQTTGPKRKDPPSDWKNETDYLSIVSRIILLSTESLIFAVTAHATSRQLSLADFMTRLLEECFAHMDAIGRPTDGKLICLALAKLLETGQPWILEKLQDLMTIWTTMIIELRDGEDNGAAELVLPVYAAAE